MSMKQETDGHAADNLALASVLVGSLPRTLMTQEAPTRYTVEAVFTRRPGGDEVRGLLGPETREILASSGYPNVALVVSDRRLEIHNTNLEELREGLARVLAMRLAEISELTRSAKEASASSARSVAARELERVAAVTELAEMVSFAIPPMPDDGADQRARTYRSQIEAWSGTTSAPR